MSGELQYFTLNNGNKIPALSIFGTGTYWFKRDESQFSQKLADQAAYVLSLPGVVHIDAAEYYRTYPELNDALKKTTKPREEIWITDKYSKLAKTPREGLEYSLKTLGVDYVDLYLLHNPFETEDYDIVSAWKILEELYKEGKAKNIGVSNFSVEDLQRIIAEAEIVPQVNQIEYSAFLQNQTPGIFEFAKKNNIQLEAYSPLGPITAVKDKQGEFYDVLKELSAKYGQEETIILLRWVYQTGVLPVTTSSKKERIVAASNIWKFELEDSEVEKISKLGAQHKPVRQYFIEEYSKYDK
jgi:diketogulonate reductase-like aldo/keto reductase